MSFREGGSVTRHVIRSDCITICCWDLNYIVQDVQIERTDNFAQIGVVYVLSSVMDKNLRQNTNNRSFVWSFSDGHYSHAYLAPGRFRQDNCGAYSLLPRRGKEKEGWSGREGMWDRPEQCESCGFNLGFIIRTWQF